MRIILRTLTLSPEHNRIDENGLGKSIFTTAITIDNATLGDFAVAEILSFFLTSGSLQGQDGRTRHRTGLFGGIWERPLCCSRRS